MPDGFTIWDTFSFKEQGELILSNFVLTEEQIEAVMREWSKGEYEDTITGHTSALSDLQQLARIMTLSEEQREAERLRIRENMK